MKNLKIALVLSALAIPALAADYSIESSHSAAEFAVRHLMVSNVRGQFSKVEGKVSFDQAKPEAIVIEATIPVASVDTREPRRDGHLKSPDFFDAEKFPTISFKSRSAVKTSEGLDVTGDLTIHGVTKTAVLHVSGITAEIKDPMGMLRRGATATTKINRQEFGVSWNKNLDSGGVVVSDEVNITLDIEAVRKAS